MKKMRNLLARYRLMTSILALLLLLGALAVTPANADVEPVMDMNCSGGCINWNKADGCQQCMYCCVYSDGSFWCRQEAGWACD